MAESRAGSYGSQHPWLQRIRRILCVGALVCASGMMSGGISFGGSPASAAPEKAVKLVAFGDSLTAGYMLPQSAAFPTVLQAALKAKGRNVEVANAGVSGDTATGGLARVDWSVPDGTDGVILELGANDMLRGTDPAITRKALEEIVQKLKARNIPVMLGGMYAGRNMGPDYVKAFESIYSDLAKKYDLVLYPFFLEGVSNEPGMTLPDGLHPSAKGVQRIVSGILPSVETFLGRLKPAS